ncbi:Membrane-bound protein lytR [uncultured Roseburia sp.]|uniref:LCP family protein n=1 Tax=Brotonthovivens ammoniilytica TaxID=2981725 RepID=A0ABT2TF53_9FIRM|nr:LCP family protein [Brotonthovivens ammoniilytica]MCU6760815.1 LCP family protein [Brotonthovivens ammoniilytica]SCI10169.1 Membrane-bound protein lytR [uncultured Roseburia sp.]
MKEGKKGFKPLKLVSLVLWLLQVAATIIFTVLVLKAGVLPALLLGIVFVIIWILAVIVGLLVLLKERKGRKGIARRVIACILAVLMIAGMIVGNKYILTTLDTLENVSNTTVEKESISVYVLKDDLAENIQDTAGYRYGILKETDRENTDQLLEEVKKETSDSLDVTEYSEQFALADALKDGEAQAIILNDAFVSMYEDEEDYAWFAEGTKVLKTTVNEKQLDLSDANEKLPSSFIMYISGIDTYGGVTERSRSDVNIMAVVNRNTHEILLVSTPRDYYIPLSVSNGQKDKLTHAGIYGVDVSMQTLEMLYGVDINYFFRLNFSGFIDMIDALGGVDVYSEKEFTVDPIASYKVGYNHLNGLEALAFARERYSFSNGDFQRGKNQMAVIQAVVQKLTSTALLNNYTDVMKSMEDCFQTSLTDADMKELIRQQLQNPTSWKISSIDVTGTGARKTTYSMPNRSASVVVPDMDSVQQARTEIERVLSDK